MTADNRRTYQAPTKKELLEARRETARLRSDMRASISTDATRPLDIKMLLKRFDVYVPQLCQYYRVSTLIHCAVAETSPHLLRDPCSYTRRYLRLRRGHRRHRRLHGISSLGLIRTVVPKHPNTDDEVCHRSARQIS